jgi:DNA-binding LacI/PurR family transcriptional regulator
LSGFETALASTGYRLLLHSAIMHEADNKGLEHLAADVDGVFVVGSPSSNERQQMARLLQKGVPVVSAGRRQLSGVEAYCVAPDNAANVALAVQQFIKDGRQRIGLVLSTMLGEHNQDRLMGYVGALAENKVEYEPDLVFVQKSSEKDEALQVWLKDKGKPDAVFVAEEDLAVNLYKKARQFGILVPDQFAITTYYDNGTAAMLGSALSIIERYDFEIGHQAASMLLSLIGGQPVQPRLKLIKGQLIIPFSGSGREPS